MLNGLLGLLGKNSNDDTGPRMEPNTFTKGFQGDLNVDAAIAFEEGNIVLAVNYDFTEAPNYVEFDLSSRHIRIIQSTGDVATLGQITVPAEQKDAIERSRKVALVTGTGEDKLMQIVPLKKEGTMSSAMAI